MITIKLNHRFQIDQKNFDRFCKERGVGRARGRAIIKEKFEEICDNYLKEESLKNDDRQSLGNLKIPIRWFYDGGVKQYDFDDMLEEFNYQTKKLREKK